MSGIGSTSHAYLRNLARELAEKLRTITADIGRGGIVRHSDVAALSLQAANLADVATAHAAQLDTPAQSPGDEDPQPINTAEENPRVNPEPEPAPQPDPETPSTVGGYVGGTEGTAAATPTEPTQAQISVSEPDGT